MEDMETAVWIPVIDFLAEELLDEVKEKGQVKFSRFLWLYEPSRVEEIMRSRYEKVGYEYQDINGCAAILTNKNLTLFVLVKDKNTPGFRHAIDKHFIDRKNRELAGRYRSSEMHRSFLRTRLLSFIAKETRERNPNIETVQSRELPRM